MRYKEYAKRLFHPLNKINRLMKSIVIWLCVMSVCLFSCKGQNPHIPAAVTQAAPMSVNRFDQFLFQLVETNDTTLQTELSRRYPHMLDILGKGVLNMKSPAMPGFFDRLVNFYSEPTLKQLYADALHTYTEISSIEQALGNGFAWLKACFPSMPLPAVYMHVSGFNQNILVGDSLLSVSIDKYLGEDFPLYQEFFYDYQRRLMLPELLVPDCIAGWLMSEYPFTGKENVLLDRMVYEGKIKYLVHHAFPELSPATLMGYTQANLDWCQENESQIWKAIIERKHLYTPDPMTTSKYFDPHPSLFLTDEAPGNLGIWIGWQIVDRYMRETNATPEALMLNNNSQEILRESKYKP